MVATGFLTLNFLFTLANAAAAELNNPSSQELCSYDMACKQAFNADGSIIKPKADILKILGELKGPIRVIAHQLGVDPRAVAGTILAENSMNVRVDADIHAAWEKMKQIPGANVVSQLLRGKSFSIGLGQIKPEAALEAEEVLAKIENRPKHSLERLKEELQGPIGSIKYGAAILRFCQDAYRKNGIDISDNPGVLTSLFNLGRCPQRAETAKAKNAKPRVNYFGLFVNKHLKDIGDTVDHDRPYEESEAKVLDDLQASDGSSANADFIRHFDKSAKLYSFPPQCDKGASGNWGDGEGDEYTKELSYRAGQAVSEGIGDFKVLAGGVDCHLDNWYLVRTSSGKIGWISNSDLEKNSSERLANRWDFSNLLEKKAECVGGARDNCGAKANEITKNKVIQETQSGPGVEVKLVGNKKHPDQVDIKKFSSRCLRGDYGTFGGMGNFAGNSPSPANITPEVASALSEEVAKKKEEIVREFKLKDWNDPNNLFRDSFRNVDGSVKQCQQYGCTGDLTQLKTFLNDDTKQYKGYKGYDKFLNKYGGSVDLYISAVNYSPHVPGKKPVDVWTDFMGDIEKNCKPVIDGSKDALSEWSAFKDFIHGQESSPTFPADIGFYGNNLFKVCDLLRASLKKDNSQSNQETEADSCNCDITVAAKGGFGHNLPSSALRGMLENMDDYSELFRGAVKLVKSQFQHFGTPIDISDTCKYDPKESAKRVEAILDLPCVEAVFVPDMYLVNHFREFKGRVFYKPFDSDDRFSFTVKNDCNSGVLK